MAFYSYLASPDETLAPLPDLLASPDETLPFLPDLLSPAGTPASVPDLIATPDDTPVLKKARKRGSVEVRELGVLCHNCRQWKLDHVVCSREKCSRKFCSSCLLNRHGESIEAEKAKNVRWVCPRCRGGCGEGCQNCCHCGPCRKMRGLNATGQITVKIAREKGFTNVHDYMVHLVTEESPAAIASRKNGRGWTSIDSPATMGVSDDVIGQEENVRWGKKKTRTTRFALATPKWGSGGCEKDLFDARIVFRSLGSNWEVGRKLTPKTKPPDCQTEERSPGSTGDTEQSPKTESTRETEQSCQSESCFHIPDSEVLAVSWVATRRLLKAWQIDENKESL